MDKLNLYKLRSRLVAENLSEVLGVLAAWDGAGTTVVGLAYPDPRLAALGLRVMLPPHLAAAAVAELGATLVEFAEYDAHRIALGIPSGGVDFPYGDAFRMKRHGSTHRRRFRQRLLRRAGVVSRMEHRGTARTRAVPLRFDGAAPQPGEPLIVAGERQLGHVGSAARRAGIALLRLDRVADALAMAKR